MSKIDEIRKRERNGLQGSIYFNWEPTEDNKLYLSEVRKCVEDRKHLLGLWERMVAHLIQINAGVLPDGDGVDISTGLWAEGWLEELGINEAEQESVLKELEGQ